MKQEYICSGELASLYSAMVFVSDNLQDCAEHAEAIKTKLIEVYMKQQHETEDQALAFFDTWRHEGNVYAGNSRGAGRRRYKVTAEDVVDIRKSKDEGVSTADLARKYGVTDRYIRKICQ